MPGSMKTARAIRYAKQHENSLASMPTTMRIQPKSDASPEPCRKPVPASTPSGTRRLAQPAHPAVQEGWPSQHTQHHEDSQGQPEFTASCGQTEPVSMPSTTRTE
ncbi:hypothetical protein P7K49_005328 [Saguinus oedipus]|uniref:Uncharacterized protein n=1 Tax=Saguinus oedipus TaxID=9490 RepID=A0ABQ9WA07_SAGOE|nr:hypothetical protein P7K49_005328 [Saguinus oedipus]